MREKCVLLKNRIDPALIRRNSGKILTVHNYLTARRHDKACDQPKKRRLAAPGRT